MKATTHSSPTVRQILHAAARAGIALAFSFMTSTARADVLVDQSSGQTGAGAGSKYATDNVPLSAALIGDFTIGSTTAITQMTAFGAVWPTTTTFPDVRAAIHPAPDWRTTPILITGGVHMADGSLSFDFGGAQLPAGTYWVTAYVVDSISGPDWYWKIRYPVTGSWAMWHNPGDIWGYGGDPVSLMTIFEGGPAMDLAYVLRGVPVMAPTPTAIPTANPTTTTTPVLTFTVIVPTPTPTQTVVRLPTPTRTRTPSPGGGQGGQQGGGNQSGGGGNQQGGGSGSLND